MWNYIVEVYVEYSGSLCGNYIVEVYVEYSGSLCGNYIGNWEPQRGWSPRGLPGP